MTGSLPLSTCKAERREKQIKTSSNAESHIRWDGIKKLRNGNATRGSERIHQTALPPSRTQTNSYPQAPNP